MLKIFGKNRAKVAVTKNGPYAVCGGLRLAKETMVPGDDGNPVKYAKGERYPDKENYSLCRCGGSRNKPYCDGAHAKNGFDGTETAGHAKYADRARQLAGPDLLLDDDERLCALGRFCDRAGGVWSLTKNSDDAEARKTAIEESRNCPSGRLVAKEMSGKPIETKFEESISLLEDPAAGVSGPIWVKGGVKIESADGKPYETRNRVTLCRCGKSCNKPFCDGGHIEAKFSDGDESIAKK